MLYKSGSIVIDFDSEILKTDGLDVISNVLSENGSQGLEMQGIVKLIKNLNLDPNFSLRDYLQQQTNLPNIQDTHIREVATMFKEHVDQFLLANRNYIFNNAAKIYVISHNFYQLIAPTCLMLGLQDDHIYANNLVYDYNRQGYSCDLTNPLSGKNGKVKLIHKLNLIGEIVNVSKICFML
jgi:hypothetical protein